VFASILDMGSVLSWPARLLPEFDHSALPEIETRVRFYKPMPLHDREKPYECEFSVDAVQDARKTNIEYDEREIVVRDVRGFEKHFNLDRNGFEVIEYKSKLDPTEFSCLDMVEQVYLPECIELLRTRYSASKVLVLGFNVRAPAGHITSKILIKTIP
jgi:hypothetical protein